MFCPFYLIVISSIIEKMFQKADLIELTTFSLKYYKKIKLITMFYQNYWLILQKFINKANYEKLNYSVYRSFE